jgi:Ni/Co efflux regulator RcnB
MRLSRWVLSGLLLFALASNAAYSVPGHGHGNGKGKDKDKHYRDDDDDRDKHDKYYRYSERDVEIRGWYGHYHDDNLPPGLAKRDRLPPGLERQLVVRGTLPPGLRKKMYRCPDDLERRLPPPPPDCRHVFIGGNLVLVNTRSFLVVDVFHFER